MLTGARLATVCLAAGALLAKPGIAQPQDAGAAPRADTAEGLIELPVDEIKLRNGMRFLFVERPRSTTVAAGWVARVGSAAEDPGQSGLSHFIEHLMFKGTRTVGARKIETELLLLEELDRTMAELAKLEDRPQLKDKQLRKRDELRAEAALIQEHVRATNFLAELSLLYSQAGATGLNANTLEDLTMFYATVPTEKLELWFWLESDRLLEPVFREFYKEKRVIDEERRQRVGSTPTGELDVEFRRRFWGESPYAALPLGEQQDIDATSRETVRSFFERHYGPSNLTGVLVGNFDRERAVELARTYFGRLSDRVEPRKSKKKDRGSVDFERPSEPMIERCDCPPQAQLRYPSVPFGHPDSYALQVLAGILNGRTGRLHRSLVLDQQLAYSASVLQHPLARDGSFLFTAEARGQADPTLLAEAWRRELDRVVSEPLPERELTKVQKQITADAYRQLQDPEALMRQLLIYDGLGDWRHIHTWPERILSVQPAEVVDVARRYLVEGRPATAFYYRQAP